MRRQGLDWAVCAIAVAALCGLVWAEMERRDAAARYAVCADELRPALEGARAWEDRNDLPTTALLLQLELTERERDAIRAERNELRGRVALLAPYFEAGRVAIVDAAPEAGSGAAAGGAN